MPDMSEQKAFGLWVFGRWSWGLDLQWELFVSQ